MEKQKVLIVDDDPQIRGLLQAFLEDEDFFVETATDGLNALEICNAHHFDAVLTDLSMPRMNGLMLLQILFQREIRPAAIALSADSYLLQQAARMGVSILSKPFDLDDVLECLFSRSFVSPL